MPGFAQVPIVPQKGLSGDQLVVIEAMRENLEVLLGLRGDGSNKAILASSITVVNAEPLGLRKITAVGAGFEFQGQKAVNLNDYIRLLGNVQTLANDVNYLRSIINLLLGQLRGD